MLGWPLPKVELSDQDVRELFTSKYAMRIDLNRGIVEYAAATDGATKCRPTGAKKITAGDEIELRGKEEWNPMEEGSGEEKLKIDLNCCLGYDN